MGEKHNVVVSARDTKAFWCPADQSVIPEAGVWKNTHGTKMDPLKHVSVYTHTHSPSLKGY